MLRSWKFAALFAVGVTLLVAGPGLAEPPTVLTRAAEAVGLTGATLNGSVHPHGVPTRTWFEYGLTAELGAKTAATPLPPRLAAFYHESWDDNFGGWLSWLKAEHFAEGGAQGGFVRFAEPSAHDHNHDNGIGTVHLVKYLYPGVHPPALYFGGGDPDLRDAKISINVRGQDFRPNGAELIWWTQSQDDVSNLGDPNARRPNWAYTGFLLTDYLRDGEWHKVEYRLRNDSTDWSYTGGNGVYKYWSIGQAQRHLNIDCFHMLVFVDTQKPPEGAMDFDELLITYRNYNLLLPSNGGKLMALPAGGDDAAGLSDGWRHGEGKQWRSAANPSGPQELVWAFANPVTISTLQLHQNPQWPAKEIEVLTSADGATFAPLVKRTLPENGTTTTAKPEPSANWAFTLDQKLSAQATHLKVRILSGHKPQHWGLGEVEVFGSGAVVQPDDETHYINTDIEGLTPGQTVYYRLVAEGDGGLSSGEVKTLQVPATKQPLCSTGPASRITAASAKLEGRLNPLGEPTEFWFEYGPDMKYGQRTLVKSGGTQISARLVFAAVEGLKAGTTYHYRLMAKNAAGEMAGQDQTFTTAANP
jgi:hypothetical protein